MESEIIRVDEEKLAEYFKQIGKELDGLEKLNKSNTDRSLDSIEAAQYGAWLLNEAPVLLSRINAFNNNAGFYEMYMNRLNKDKK